MTIPIDDEFYVTSVRELVAGILLVAVTIAIHGFGMLLTLRSTSRMKERADLNPRFFSGLWVLILASWMIIFVHLVEVGVWASFFHLRHAVKDAVPTFSTAYYFAMMDYTTLGSAFTLKPEWRLLSGMIAIAGLLTFAWSTGVLLMLAQSFQEKLMERIAKRANGGK